LSAGIAMAANTPSERERTFLNFVFSGDEAKAVEYAQAASINVNSIAGDPLSTWFYRDGSPRFGQPATRNLAVQRIVFERFRQNPNPPNIGENKLGQYCGYAPVPQDFGVEGRGTPEQKRALRERQEAARRPHIDAMAAGFNSLVRYGLRDRAIINALFEACVFRNAAPLTPYVYDTVLAPMIKAGANVNLQTPGGQRPIAFAVEKANAPVIERLIRDGAQVNYPVLLNGFDRPGPNEQCQPLRHRSVYQYVFKWVRVSDPDNVVAVVRALATGGLSPMTKYGYIENPNGRPICKFASFHDAVIDSGNLDFARKIKEAGARPAAAAPPPAQAPRTEQANASAPAAIPSQVGAWLIRTKNDGRLHATAKVSNGHPDRLAGLILECMPGGRLEYVPAVLKLNGFAKSLYVHGKDDNMNGLNLSNGRLSGESAATLTRELLQAEINAFRQGLGANWDIGMTVDDPYVEESLVQMTGFTRMRKLMQSNCKN